MKVLCFILVGVVHGLITEMMGIPLSDPSWWVLLGVMLFSFVILTRKVEEQSD